MYDVDLTPRRSPVPVPAALLLLVLIVAPPLLRATDAAGGLAAGDETRVRRVLEAYRKAWLANDAEGVLRLFHDDAVLMPHHGVEPVVGKAAARAFWFPAGPPTTVTAFTLTIDQVGGAGAMAWARGRSHVEWVTGTGPGAKTSANTGTNLTVLRRHPDGTWRITVMMWDDPLPQPAAPPR